MPVCLHDIPARIGAVVILCRWFCTRRWQLFVLLHHDHFAQTISVAAGFVADLSERCVICLVASRRGIGTRRRRSICSWRSRSLSKRTPRSACRPTYKFRRPVHIDFGLSRRSSCLSRTPHHKRAPRVALPLTHIPRRAAIDVERLAFSATCGITNRLRENLAPASVILIKHHAFLNIRKLLR